MKVNSWRMGSALQFWTLAKSSMPVMNNCAFRWFVRRPDASGSCRSGVAPDETFLLAGWRNVPGPLARENEGRRRPARLALCRCEHHHRHDDPFTAPAADAVACSWDPRRRIHGHPWVVHDTEAHRAKNLVRCRHRTCLPPSTVLRPSS